MENQIEGFPIEIVNKMIQRQVEQGNPPNIEVFKNTNWESVDGGGFSWDKTVEGGEFWEDIIFNENFNIFFERYPKTNPLTIKA